MSHPMQAFVAPRIFTGVESVLESAILMRDGLVRAVVHQSEIPADTEIITFSAGVIAPGFVDLQVNGGGGVLFNDQPTLDGIRTICATHIALGSTSIFPTLISDTTSVTKAAVSAAIEATKQQVPGFAGLHLEGPYLDPEKHGAHNAEHLRPMTNANVTNLIEARKNLPALIVTLAPEAATVEQVRALVAGGVKVSLGHSNCSAETAHEYFAAGATLATHLFNAMSGISARNPGLAAAALNNPQVSAGMIVDCFHVAPETIRLALAANASPGKVFLVSDAMPVVGTDLNRFELSGKTSFRDAGTLKFEDGGLAGADLCLAQAVRNMRHKIGLDVEEALRMATSHPATAAGLNSGRLIEGVPADFIWLDDELRVRGVWLGGGDVPL